MKRETRFSEIKLVLLALLVSGSLYAMPTAYSSRIYHLIRDAARPGLALVQQFKSWESTVAKSEAPDPRLKQLEQQLNESKQTNRRLELQSLQVTEELQRLKQTGVPNYQTQASDRLLVPDLLE
ncbi:MAG: hypothetical protein KDA70_18945, partial [Planctomycetaceae bacterium]|nr:hypothetical protein [Planctomycetaceae bacterium]